MVGDPVMPRFETPRLDRALNERWPSDAATTPDRAPVPVLARVDFAGATNRIASPSRYRVEPDAQE
jgi:hypothetical protein